MLTLAGLVEDRARGDRADEHGRQCRLQRPDLYPVVVTGSAELLAAESLGDNPQWYTVPIGLALLVAVGLLPRDARRRGRPIGGTCLSETSGSEDAASASGGADMMRWGTSVRCGRSPLARVTRASSSTGRAADF